MLQQPAGSINGHTRGHMKFVSSGQKQRCFFFPPKDSRRGHRLKAANLGGRQQTMHRSGSSFAHICKAVSSVRVCQCQPNDRWNSLFSSTCSCSCSINTCNPDQLPKAFLLSTRSRAILSHFWLKLWRDKFSQWSGVLKIALERMTCCVHQGRRNLKPIKSHMTGHFHTEQFSTRQWLWQLRKSPKSIVITCPTDAKILNEWHDCCTKKQTNTILWRCLFEVAPQMAASHQTATVKTFHLEAFCTRPATWVFSIICRKFAPKSFSTENCLPQSKRLVPRCT